MKSGHLLLLTTALFLSFNVHAQANFEETVGVSGLGVLCKKSNTLETLFEYKNKSLELIWDDPTQVDKSGFLYLDHEYFRQHNVDLKSLGPANEIPYKKFITRLVNSENQITNWHSVFANNKFNFNNWKQIKNLNAYDVIQKMTKLPADCSLVQLGYSYKGQNYKVEPYFSKLTEKQKFIVAIEMTLYNFAAINLEHNTVNITHSVLKEILKAKLSPQNLERAVHSWLAANRKASNMIDPNRKYLKDTKTFHIQGNYQLVDKNQKHKCPEHFLIIKNSVNTFYTTWLNNEDKKVSLIKHDANDLNCDVLDLQTKMCKLSNSTFSLQILHNFNLVSGDSQRKGYAVVQFSNTSEVCKYQANRSVMAKDIFDEINLIEQQYILE